MSPNPNPNPSKVEVPDEVKRFADFVVLNAGIALALGRKNQESNVEITVPLLLPPSFLKAITEDLELMLPSKALKTKEEKQQELLQGFTAIFSDAIQDGILKRARRIAISILKEKGIKDELIDKLQRMGKKPTQANS